MIRAAVICVVLLVSCSSFALDYAPRIRALIEQLGSESTDEQRAAALELVGLPHFALPELESIVKQTQTEKAAMILKHALQLVRARQRVAEQRGADGVWSVETTVDAYKKVGRKDPRWDALAIAALQRVAAEWNAVPWEPGDLLGAIDALRAAILAGCDDPLIDYAFCRLSKAPPAAYKSAAQALERSSYPSVRKFNALTYAAEALVKSEPLEAGRMLGAALQLLPDVAADARVPFATKYAAGKTLREVGGAFYKNSLTGYEIVDKALAPRAEKNALPHALKGEFYTQYAWEIRGDGTADTVGPDNWKRFRDRLSIARMALELAHQLAPNDNQAANMMLTTELGAGSRLDVLEQWFSRAVLAGPYDNVACMSKMFYLQPQWHGSNQEMLQFARTCLKTKNVYGSWNRVLLFYNQMELEKHGDSCYRRYSFWRDMREAYEQELAVFPTRVTQRSRLALHACKAGEYAYAHREFELLKDRPDLEVFGGEKKYNELRAKAAKLAPNIVPTLATATDKLQVTKASFGSGGNKRDVTATLNQLLEKDPMGLIFAGVSIFGDPAPYKTKQLSIEYLIGETTHSFSLGEGDPFILPGYRKGIPIESKKFNIVAARWIGHNGLSLDVTERLRDQVESPLSMISINNETLGGDPSPHQKKKLVVWVDYDGRRFMRWYAEDTETMLEP